MNGGICIIPARGGSQRIPRKNIRDFCGKPIVAYSIETAFESDLFDQVLVSTEDDEIADIASTFGADVLKRPLRLADNLTGTQDVMKHALNELRVDSMYMMACCLYPTAPMLSPFTLIEADNLLQRSSVSYVVPIARWLRDPGQFYMGNAGAFQKGRSLTDCTLLEIDPATECDINTEEDWVKAEKMYARLKGLK